MRTTRHVPTYAQCDDTCTTDCGHCKGDHDLTRAAADQTPATAAQALAQAVRESVAEYVRRASGTTNLAASYWDGYRAAGNEIADLLEDPALLDQHPALGAPPRL